MMADGVLRIERKMVVGQYYSTLDGLIGKVLYLQKDSTFIELFWCDICEEQSSTGTWKKENNILTLEYSVGSKIDTFLDCSDSLIIKETGKPCFYKYYPDRETIYARFK
jgi:hypothetical protein